MMIGAELALLDGYPFEVRYSQGARGRARAAADLAAGAFAYFRQLFPRAEPDIALIVAREADWKSRQPYGLPFFNNDKGQVRPGILVTSADRGAFWVAIGESLRQASPQGFNRLLATYPDGLGGLDLQPFFDLIIIHELGHAFEVLGDLRLPTLWLGEIFANLVLHAFVATKQPERVQTLEVFSIVGSQSRRLAARMRAEGLDLLCRSPNSIRLRQVGTHMSVRTRWPSRGRSEMRRHPLGYWQCRCRTSRCDDRVPV